MIQLVEYLDIETQANLMIVTLVWLGKTTIRLAQGIQSYGKEIW
ncbi:hypothetical protein JCM19240_3709 [Vibrio maritimus]|uniref:Uncharacterized protein n=1 Tax=Vibrio maritimus TaxID=990268 RepID=A0A090T9A3_9VIBR|nr:hypothetical protein JCM19240_3709 [Vibrio maritimus]